MRFLVVLLTFGALTGLWSGAHHGWSDRHAEFERHVADICADSALRAAGKAALPAH
jgi:hypothetical protein